MTPAEAHLHLRYSAWASRKLVAAVRALPDADFEKPVGVSHHSLLGTLAHILWGDWLWFTRVAGPFEQPAQTRLALETAWPEIHEKWIAWAECSNDAEINRIVEYKSILDGKMASTPAWQIVLHVVNHATLHRGQAMGMLRQMGIEPPHTDLLFFYRELAATGRA
ncbi:MAG TPA: DinB family protein [Bryobacteraceae bacterium]|nr:DinB family protein [Bryobacteraceae bacterium]